jgi:hypothetical protein
METTSPDLNPQDVAALDSTTAGVSLPESPEAPPPGWYADAAAYVSTHALSSMLVAAVAGGAMTALLMRAAGAGQGR